MIRGFKLYPGEKEEYLSFYVGDETRAVSFAIRTDMRTKQFDTIALHCFAHALTPTGGTKCDFIEGECEPHEIWSQLRCNEVLELLLTIGSEAVYTALEEAWKERFDAKPERDTGQGSDGDTPPPRLANEA